MKTQHKIIMEDAHDMAAVVDGSIHLVVTSPPYPMIEMWDDLFAAANVEIHQALRRSDADQAFELMHQYLDGVWHELQRVLAPGGIACINIGDATRTILGHFRLFSNHARIIKTFHAMGFSQLPTIIWRKTTNAPNKFMGSGMLPPGAYVTLEHEYILIFRNGSKRDFADEKCKERRRQSAYFWEERNNWFSDVWMGLTGTVQNIRNSKTRSRMGAFPLELPYRLINMFSVKEDTVLDPFLGSGTTMLAAMCSGRNSIGFEIDEKLKSNILERFTSLPDTSFQLIEDRLQSHREFVATRQATRDDLKYQNDFYGVPVMTRQEQDLSFDRVKNIQYHSGRSFSVQYESASEPTGQQKGLLDDANGDAETILDTPRTRKGRQLKLF